MDECLTHESITVPIGTTENRTIFSQDLNTIPHILICGYTGTGKTSFAQTILANIMQHYTPADIRFIIYDSKMVDYGIFHNTPHMLLPVIMDAQKAVAAFAWAQVETRKRFRTISEAHARDITSYNHNAQETGSDKLPHIYMVIDDYSSLEITDENAAIIETILKEGRAVGIHLVLVTSSTSSKILKKDIRSNIPCRISFRVSSKADSRMAIDSNGAEALNIPGEILFRWQNTLAKCQASYIPYEEVKTMIENIKLTNPIYYSDEILHKFEQCVAEKEMSTKRVSGYAPEEVSDKYDELLPVAIEAMVETGMASVSMLQQRLKLGYSRAAHLVDQMEEIGVVGPFEGSKPRQVLITKKQWQEMQYKQGMMNLATDIPPAFNESEFWQDTTKFSPEGFHTEDNSEKPDILMRSYPLFYIGKNCLSVSDNRIKLQIKIATKFGPGTISPSFNGKSVAELIYKKPGLFSVGYIQFKIKPGIDIIASPLLNISHHNLDNFLKIEFERADAKKVREYMEQIAKDIGKSLIVL